jgi:small subunit ribosomal protein S4
MARYTGARCRLSRREGVDLELTSKKRSLESKCKAETPPGQHGEKTTRPTDYRNQLRMKQLIKRYYGLLERQFRNYYHKSERLKGSTGENLLRLLETRLDNVVYRLGFASTRAEARQMITHKGFTVNGKLVNIPSYAVAVDDEVAVREKSKDQIRIKSALQAAEAGVLPEWLQRSGLTGVLKRYPDMSELPPEFKVHLIVEFYSK